MNSSASYIVKDIPERVVKGKKLKKTVIKYVLLIALTTLALISVTAVFYKCSPKSGKPSSNQEGGSGETNETRPAPFHERSKHVGINNSNGQEGYAIAAIQLLYSIPDFQVSLKKYLEKGPTESIVQDFRTAASLYDIFEKLDEASTSAVDFELNLALPGSVQSKQHKDAADVLNAYRGIDMNWNEFDLQCTEHQFTEKISAKVFVFPLREIVLDIVASKSHKFPSISSLLELHFADRISYSNDFGDDLPKTIRTQIESYPKNLFIRLNRFPNVAGETGKIGSPVKADKIIDLGPFDHSQSWSKGSKAYTLRGFIEHRGDSIDEGQFITYIGDKEYHDDQVRDAETDPEDPNSLLAAKTAYMYWYHLN